MQSFTKPIPSIAEGSASADARRRKDSGRLFGDFGSYEVFDKATFPISARRRLGDWNGET